MPKLTGRPEATEVDSTDLLYTVKDPGDTPVSNKITKDDFLKNTERVVFDTTAAQNYLSGQLSYDSVSKTLLADTGFTGVRVNIGQETHFLLYNNSGDDWSNGDVLTAEGGVTGDFLNGALARSSTLGPRRVAVATADILDGNVGPATLVGAVNDINTNAFGVGDTIYLSDTPGTFTATKPLFPNTRLVIGKVLKKGISDGVVQVFPFNIKRNSANRSYHFTSQGIGSGTYWKGGFYNWDSTDANLDQGSTSVTHGVSGITYAAHVGIVSGGAGVVDTGQVGIRVTGTLDNEEGNQTASQTEVITDDITTLTADTMIETPGKFSGEVTIELYVVSGTPGNYSLDFNYGYSKYEDMGNRDATVVLFEAVWQGGASDSAFNVSLLHHKADGWVYAASNFVPGDGTIADRLTRQAIDSNVADGVDGDFKAIGLNQFIQGSQSEGIMVKIVTNSNNSIQTMDIHVTAYSEEVNR